MPSVRVIASSKRVAISYPVSVFARGEAPWQSRFPEIPTLRQAQGRLVLPALRSVGRLGMTQIGALSGDTTLAFLFRINGPQRPTTDGDGAIHLARHLHDLVLSPRRLAAP